MKNLVKAHTTALFVLLCSAAMVPAAHAIDEGATGKNSNAAETLYGLLGIPQRPGHRPNNYFSAQLTLDTAEFEGQVKMSCWTRQGARKAEWTRDVPASIAADEVGMQCSGFVHISVVKDNGKWKKLATLRKCTGEGKHMRFAYVDNARVKRGRLNSATVVQHCLSNAQHGNLPQPPEQPKYFSAVPRAHDNLFASKFIRLECFANEDDKKPRWSDTVVKLYSVEEMEEGISESRRGKRCLGVVKVDVLEVIPRRRGQPGGIEDKWRNIGVLRKCTGEGERMNFAYVHDLVGTRGQTGLNRHVGLIGGKVKQHCLDRVTHTDLPKKPSLPRFPLNLRPR